MAFEDILWPQGQQNMAGLVGGIFFIPKEDLGALPALAQAGDLVLAADLLPAQTKEFIEIYHTPETGKIDQNTIGEIDGMANENVLEFFVPGNSEAVSKFKRLVINTSGVWIAKDTDGNYRILGVSVLDPAGTVLSSELDAKVSAASGTTGQGRGDRRGTTFTVTFKAPHDPLFYTGVVTLDPVP